jgi:hypothetical protein
MPETLDEKRQRLHSARYADAPTDAMAALDEMVSERQYDLVLDALTDERPAVRERAAAIATRLLDDVRLDLSQLPGEVSFGAYFGQAELAAVRELARPCQENVAGMIALFWPSVEGTLRALSEEEFDEAGRQSKPLQKIRLDLPGALLFKARLFAWRFDRSPSAVLHVVCALGMKLARNALPR